VLSRIDNQDAIDTIGSPGGNFHGSAHTANLSSREVDPQQDVYMAYTFFRQKQKDSPCA
jgi:hypothetical protein